eukprot:scaffold54828_cov66-Phaeocystis_antarctica.AAC.2
MPVDEHGTGPHAQARAKEVTNGLHAIVLHRVSALLWVAVANNVGRAFHHLGELKVSRRLVGDAKATWRQR